MVLGRLVYEVVGPISIGAPHIPRSPGEWHLPPRYLAGRCPQTALSAPAAHVH
jgi:hypothetical protein